MAIEHPCAVVQRAMVLAAAWSVLVSAAAVGQPRHVLVLYSNDRLLPANLAMDTALAAALSASAQVSAEFLGAPRFSGAAYGATLAKFLREKYAAWPPDVVVVLGDEALVFVLQHRAELFAQIPVVGAAVEKSLLESLPPLPAGVIAVPVVYDFRGTIALALHLHPRARRLVFVTGTSSLDRAWEAQLRELVPRFKGRTTAEFLAVLGTDAILKRLGEVGGDAVVVTPGYFRDGAGHEFVPRQALKAMAQATAAPVYGPFDTFMGAGIVGGSIVSFTTIGREAGEAVSALLAGTPPEGLHLPALSPTALHLDWRQVFRWGIDPAAIPADAVIDFKQPPFLEQCRDEAIAGTLVFLAQSGFMGWLLTERRRRRMAEQAMQKQHFELAHACRLATAGELTASIAHEINQPLGAILSNADAADLLLEGGVDRQAELRAILADIRRDDLRASEVIRRLRALLTKHEVERQAFVLSQVVSGVASMLAPEACRRRLTLGVRLASGATLVGDPFQIEQLLLNLILNAMEAMADAPEGQRAAVVSVETVADRIALSVRDHGHGIAPEHLPQLFDSFFSTKREGMGFGLSISRTIVEAHGGRIWAENAPVRGAVFHVSLPAAPAAGVQSSAPMSAAPLIHVVDDDEPLRGALLRLLNVAGFEARGYGSAGEFLLEPLRPRPGCVLLDLRLPGPSGLELQAALQGQGVTLPIIFLTGHADVASSVEAMKAGAADFLTKPVQGAALLDAIERALARAALERAAREEAARLQARLDSLTPRERAVLDLVAAGRRNKDIAEALGIAERTVKLRRAQLKAKLDVASSAELGRMAERLREISD
jgi:FixJ family two-component response regulator/signal transduction histidine kinase